MQTEIQPAQFTGWAVVDVLGHQRFAGHVTTEHYGQVAFFRVETPEREPRETVLAAEEFVSNDYGYQKPGTKVLRAGKPGSVRLIGAGSIYMLTPSTREAVIAHLDESEPCPLVSVIAPDGTPVEMVETPF